MAQRYVLFPLDSSVKVLFSIWNDSLLLAQADEINTALSSVIVWLP